MHQIPSPRLVSLYEAFRRAGESYVPDWTGAERRVASLGQGSKDPTAKKRAQKALAILVECARDGRVGVVAYRNNGTRFRYFESSPKQISSLLLHPDIDEVGFIELDGGEMLPCEIDIASMNFPTRPRSKVGRKPKFPDFESLIVSALDAFGLAATNPDLKNFARKEIGDRPYPRANSTVNEIIDRIRSRYRHLATGNENPVDFQSAAYGGLTPNG